MFQNQSHHQSRYQWDVHMWIIMIFIIAPRDNFRENEFPWLSSDE